MSYLISIDPSGVGGHTGVVLIGYGDDTPAYLIDSWAVEGDFEGFLDWWEEHRDETDMADYIICEHFVNWGKPGADLMPLAIEGAVRALCRVDRQDKPSLSPASGKDTAVPDAALKRMGMWLPGDHHHDRREAARHGLWFLKRMRHRPTLEKMYPPNID